MISQSLPCSPSLPSLVFLGNFLGCGKGQKRRGRHSVPVKLLEAVQSTVDSPGAGNMRWFCCTFEPFSPVLMGSVHLQQWLLSAPVTVRMLLKPYLNSELFPACSILLCLGFSLQRGRKYDYILI